MKKFLATLFVSILILAPQYSHAEDNRTDVKAAGQAAQAATANLKPSITLPTRTPDNASATYVQTMGDTRQSATYTECKQWNETGGTVYYSCPIASDVAGKKGTENFKIVGSTVSWDVYDASNKFTSSSAGNAAQATAIAQSAGAPTETSSSTCLPGNIACYLTQGLAEILQGIAFVFMQITSWLLGIVGVMFNWLVVVTIFQFAVFFGNSEGMLLAWGILRDVGNILILFGFIYAGVMMVLDLHSFDARKAIPRLIIFAVLLNFSLFTGEAIVDVSNVLSAKLYQQAGQSVFKNCNGATSLTECTNQVGIAEVIIQDTGLGSSYSFSKDGTSGGAVALGGSDHVKNLLAYVGVTILMGIVLILLLAASLMLLMRAITLVILLITSPIGFVGFAIPQLESQAKKWWETLLSNAFFAPIFLLLLFIGLKVMDGLREAMGGENQTLINALSNPNVSIGSILIVFSLIVGFFLAALMFAKNSGAAGAQFATNFAQKTVTGALSGGAGATGGLARWGYGSVARKAIGGTGRTAARKYNETMGKLKQKPGFIGGLAKAADYVAGDSITGFGNGLAKKKFGGIRSLEESEAHQKHRDHETHGAYEKTQHVNDLNTMLNTLPRGTFVPGSTAVRDINDPAEKARNKKIAEQLEKMGDEQINQVMKKADKAVDGAFDSILRNLSKKKFDKRIEDHNFDHDLKHDMEARRFDTNNAPRVLQNMKPEEKAKLPDGILQEPHVLAALEARDLAAIDPNNIDPDTLTAIRNYVNADRTTPKMMKFLGLIDQGGTRGTANTAMKNRWSGVTV